MDNARHEPLRRRASLNRGAMSIVAVVQARMSSTRLPGKVLKDLGGAPILDWVVERLRRARSLDGIVIATTTNPADDPIVERARSLGVDVFRGSEEDVLDRYWEAVERTDAQAVVRVTSDCPFVDPALVDRVVEVLREQDVDYASNILDPRTFPRGLDVEAFTREVLDEAAREATRPSWREHVTPFFYRQPDRFGLAGVWHEADCSDERWTVDTPEDLRLLRKMAERVQGRDFGWEEALDVVERHPELRSINRRICQKPVE